MKPNPRDAHSRQHYTAAPYVVGFVLSIMLTLGAYWLAAENILAGWQLAGAITGLALVQLVVQLIFFLHVGRRKQAAADDPRWDRLVLYFSATVVIIVVAGSLWIMNNVQGYGGGRHQPSPQEVERQLIREEGINR